ncbi:unnamed protein product (macronuclear) [Paramecium tetraurelia]|uniref:Protein kinase domain-containing protein n=1 Tax=Paramecium tetraurelia TaxID=5888 RepID=A0BIX9_PARTE|nr:uncharacterized protein GSPATT00004869001 [Paramecium tetraurelia]CAK58496.1 unnamed protein product [Paramecium tetraurelia]|eukprot:XP_001425894.1 hypothetical protein (macronuclear) [Paramecium tetraurelia strain d4-2]
MDNLLSVYMRKNDIKFNVIPPPPTQFYKNLPIQQQTDQKNLQFQGRAPHHHNSFHETRQQAFSFTLLTLEMLHNNLDHIQIQQIKYKVIKKIGQGSFGQVFLLNKENSNLYFALKVQKQINEQEKKILLDLKGIKFKNLVNTIDCLQNCQTKEYFVLMEYCEKSLQDVINQEKLNHQDARYIIKQIANGIRELHEKQIIHRDLKPENILVFSYVDGENTQITYKICDFGLSSTKEISQTYKCGTSHYMAPEGIQNLSNKFIGYTASVDIWALGAVIYELFSGEVLFMGNSNQEIFDLILSTKQESLEEKIKNKIGNLEHVNLVLQMMQIDPNKRITINEVINKLTKGGTKKINKNKSVNDLQVSQFQPNKIVQTMTQQPITDAQREENHDRAMKVKEALEQCNESIIRGNIYTQAFKQVVEQQDNHSKSMIRGNIHTQTFQQVVEQQDNHAKSMIRGKINTQALKKKPQLL